MAMIGSIEAFKGQAEEFESYLERMEHLFDVNEVPDAKKVSMLITLAGSSVYNTMKNLVAPRKPAELTYVQMTDLLRKHYAPPVSEISERFVFNRCNQRLDQSIAEYIVELRKVASTCNFGGQFLDEALRDRFVCGVNSENIQKKLLSEAVLTFPRACSLAQGCELADKQVKMLANASPINFVQKHKQHVTKNQSYRQRIKHQPDAVVKAEVDTTCSKCGRIHLKEKKCPAARWRCYACSKFGHVTRLCPSKADVVMMDTMKSIVIY
ncbi:unnamed protein product [Phaedon cochleariae]|uniref:CCHC-type domain-containing protein n=1 Tax=Phaedon cochleariae TaxID=80249 RepID=A0A9N9SF82_PHACE|nr:unnamed protein product [Phaedon cochleariae]